MTARFLRSTLPGVLALAALPLAAADGGPYRFLKEIPVGGDGGWDYVTVDPAGHRLYVSHATEVVVIDTDKDAVVGRIAETPGIHGIALAPGLKRGFTSNGRENKVGIVDLGTLAATAKVEAGTNPDCILFASKSNEVWAFNGRSHSATVIDAASGQVAATVPLPGKPEFAVYDPAAGRIYDNLEDKSEVAVIDAAARKVVAEWPIAPGESGSGLALDRANHRLFIGCDNKLMVMMDSLTGKVLGTVPIDEGNDANAFDPGTGFAFSSNSSGTVTVAREDAPDRLSVVQVLPTAPRAHTLGLDTVTHRLYVPSATFLPPPADAPPKTRPKMAPGSFKILVYGLGS